MTAAQHLNNLSQATTNNTIALTELEEQHYRDDQ
jgi:hypothetical protein